MQNTTGEQQKNCTKEKTFQIKNRYNEKIIIEEQSNDFKKLLTKNKSKLFEADLRKKGLRRIDLREADLRRVDLSDADIWGANLRKADLWEMVIKEHQILDLLKSIGVIIKK